jgi:hypothetical protein
MISEMSPQEFLARRAAGTPMTLLDVREDWEVELAPVPAELVHIPMGQIGGHLPFGGPQHGGCAIFDDAGLRLGCQPGGRNLEMVP